MNGVASGAGTTGEPAGRRPLPLRPAWSRASARLALYAVPLVILILGLAAAQFERQRAGLLGDLARTADEERHVARALLGEVGRTLGRMRNAVEADLRPGGAPPPASPLRARLTPERARLAPDGGFEALTLRPGPDGREAGNLLGLPDLTERGGETGRRLDAGLRLLETLALEHSVANPAVWSYFFSAEGDFITIFPRAGLQGLTDYAARKGPVTDAAALVAFWLGYDVFRLGTPERNPGRTPYWTRVYEDAAGAGPVTSHAAPVYAGELFVGIVGTDIPVTLFQSALWPAERQIGLSAIVGPGGDVLGLSDANPDSGARGRAEAAYRTTEAEAAGTSGFRRVAGGWLLSQPLDGTPFRLLHTVSDGEVAAELLPRFAPYALILTGLAATVIALVVHLHRAYVAPSERLADYVAAAAAGAAPPAPVLPADWRTRFRRIAGAFAQARDYRERLEASEARFEAAASSLPDGFAILDRDGRLVFRNDAFAAHLAPEGRARLAGGVPARDLLGAAPETLPPERRLEDGRWIGTRIGRMPDGGTVLLLRDVTEARQADAALRESEARYRAVVNTQTEMVARFTPDGRATFVNDAYCRYMNMTAAELQAPECDHFAYIVPEDRIDHDAHVAHLSREAPTATVVFRSVLPDGKLYWEEWTDTGVFDADGRLIELQAVGRDVTDKRRAEEELARQTAALHQSEKLSALGSLLAGVAHELNNPLSIVVGYSGMLCELAPDPDTARRAREINVAADRCARIVKGFLAMARSKPVERKPAYLDDIVDDALELAGYGLRRAGITVLREEGRDVGERAGKSLPPVFVDPDQIHQVLMNLVLNAQQALAGRPEPTLTLATARAGEALHLVVADNGCGMDEAVRARAFEPFFTTKPQGVGTGIGLSVCHGIVAAHGGTMELESAAGQGTRFRVSLPLWQGRVRPPETAPAALPLRGRLLVVDDEPAIARLVAQALRAEPLEVVALSDPREALMRLLDESFDALLTDLRMPDLSGEELIASLLARRPEMRGRIVAMTGDALGVGLSGRHADVPILEKPLDIAGLRAALAPILAAPAAIPAATTEEPTS